METVRTSRLRPAAARRLLRFELACALRDAGVTHREMGERLGISRASFSQVVAGTNLPHPAALEIIAGHLGILDDLPRLRGLLRTARSERQQGTSGGDRELAEALEAYAEKISLYDSAALSPMLACDRRSAVLTASDSPVVTWIVEEHVLRREDAVARVRPLLGHIEFRVVPLSRRTHPGLRGGFQIVHGLRRSVVCEDTRQAMHYHVEPELVAEYGALFTYLEGLALNAEESLALIHSL